MAIEPARHGPDTELLARYDREVRAEPEAPAGFAVEKCHGVVSLIGHFNIVLHSELRAGDVERVVGEYAARYRERGQDLEWHIYSHDGPIDLPRHLAAQGFVIEHTATLLVMDTGAACAAIPASAGVDIRRITDAVGLRDYVSAGIEAFGTDDGQFDASAGRLDDPHLALYAAYADGRPVAAGRLETDSRCGFGRLFGGGVAPAHRGRGFYRGLVAARAQRAREIGVATLATTALESSRPILERLGFRGLDTMTCWLLRAGTRAG